MAEAFICDAIRTPIGRYGGALAAVRADDLAAMPIRALMARNPNVDWAAVDDVILGCANQAGEDNRNVARMAALLAGLDVAVPGATVNRLCGSGLNAVGIAAAAIRAGEGDLFLAGGVESMSARTVRDGQGGGALLARRADVRHDDRLALRQPGDGEGLRHRFDAGDGGERRRRARHLARRPGQDGAAQPGARGGRPEVRPARRRDHAGDHPAAQRRADRRRGTDEHPRATTMEALAKLKPIVRPDGTVTAGNASGVNDGAAALIVASEDAAKRHGLTPRARVVTTAVAGVPPRVMGIGPEPATRKALARAGISVDRLEVIELNEAFAAQGIAVLRALGVPEDGEHINPNGGAIALGHPLGMSGARLALTAVEELVRRKARYGLATMCIGVGQGIAMVLERV